MSTTVADPVDWQRWFRHLPLGLLAGVTVVALATGPATGATSPGWRLAAQLALAALTAAWLAWTTYGARHTQSGPTPRRYVVRTLLAFALTLLNPLFCIFAWIGFADATETFKGRRVWWAFAATAAVMALGQSSGVREGVAASLAFFLVLMAVNFGLAAAMGRYSLHVDQTHQERAVALAELERVNRALEETLQRNESLQDTVVAQARVAGVHEERQRLAREIHDTIAQSLAGVLAQLQAAEQEQAPGPRIARATELTRAALAEARRSVMDLAPAALADTGLPEAVQAIVSAWAADHPARAEVVVTGDVRPLHPEVEATVLRVVQEALANVARHAAAQRVGVTLSYEGEEVLLDVRDDGVGFDPGQPAKDTSFGVRGMRQRAERLAGDLTLESSRSGGTAVSLRLPALPREAA